MPDMRDKETGVLRDVPQRTLDRWPDDYEKPETAAKREARKRKAKAIHVEPTFDDDGLPVTTDDPEA